MDGWVSNNSKITQLSANFLIMSLIVGGLMSV